METQTTVSATVNNAQPTQPVHVPRTLKQRFIDYFTKAYPIVRRIKIKRNKYGHFRARVWYRSDKSHRINATAQTYETLVIIMEAKFRSRNIPRAYNR